jgi:hypothetical protein
MPGLGVIAQFQGDMDTARSVFPTAVQALRNVDELFMESTRRKAHCRPGCNWIASQPKRGSPVSAPAARWHSFKA